MNEVFQLVELAVQKIMGVSKHLKSILTYFENNSINSPLTKRRSVCTYFNFIGRQTNNDVEGFNRICNILLKSKQSIYKFINGLKRFD